VRGGKIFDYFLQVGMWMVGWIFLQVFACDGVGCVIDSVVWESAEWQVLFFCPSFLGGDMCITWLVVVLFPYLVPKFWK
jgi:hypothetical protein